MRHATLAVVGGLLVAACGGTGQNIDEEGCAYLDGGPFTAITAGTAMDGTAPAIAADARAFTITLPAGTGYVRFDSTDDTEYAVFTNRTVSVAAYTPTGTEISPSASSTSSSVCTTIMGRHIIELQVGAFFFAIGTDAGGPINLVLRPYNPD